MPLMTVLSAGWRGCQVIGQISSDLMVLKNVVASGNLWLMRGLGDSLSVSDGEGDVEAGWIVERR
ncbi:hypothetical protein [Paracoccus yeei]|uniref:hypothetical protein n=1 Tax=Paracoccus yeei TaxID=147645 RepID=UPI003BF817FA